jgi:hypothetical protein
MIKTWVAKLLTVKAATVLAVTAAGGVALAATTGTLPNPLTGTAAAPSSAADGAGRPTTTPTHPGAGPSELPSPSLLGLCHAYTAGAGSDHGKALSDPAFTALITAAGGTDKVDSYCKALLASPPGNAPSHPTGAPNGTAGAGNQHPTGEPTSHPTGDPTSHPSGSPAPHPSH